MLEKMMHKNLPNASAHRDADTMLLQLQRVGPRRLLPLKLRAIRAAGCWLLRTFTLLQWAADHNAVMSTAV